jgi:DNA repair protein RAD7
MMNEKQRPNPGQLDNCEICGKRFTVTAYSKTGPNGGLLCADCSKKHVDGGKKGPAKKSSSGIGRRKNQSNLLDGMASHGTQSLLETCIKVCPRITSPSNPV